MVQERSCVLILAATNIFLLNVEKPKWDRDTKEEVNIVQFPNDETSGENEVVMLVNEEKMTPKLMKPMEESK